MSWYHLTNKQKYGINEIQYFANTEKDMLLMIDMNWKWGSFHINQEDPVDDITEPFELYSEFDEANIDALESGTEEFTFKVISTGEVLDNAAFEEFIEQYYDEGINFLYDNGYEEERDPEFWITGGFALEEIENPYEF